MKIQHALLCWLVMMPGWVRAKETKTPAKTDQFPLICLGYCHGSDCIREAALLGSPPCGPRKGTAAFDLGSARSFPTFSCPVRRSRSI